MCLYVSGELHGGSGWYSRGRRNIVTLMVPPFVVGGGAAVVGFSLSTNAPIISRIGSEAKPLPKPYHHRLQGCIRENDVVGGYRNQRRREDLHDLKNQLSRASALVSRSFSPWHLFDIREPGASC